MSQKEVRFIHTWRDVHIILYENMQKCYEWQTMKKCDIFIEIFI